MTTAVWSSGQPLLHARRNPTATTLGDGTVLVVGGEDLGSGTAATTAERWNGARWTEAPAPPIAFTRHTATLLADGSVLLVGPDGAALFEP